MKPHLLDRIITILLGINLFVSFWSLAVNFPGHHQVISTIT
ncbi:MAG: hypothetical protein WAU47_01680 [Desulfobaccales bacterium]